MARTDPQLNIRIPFELKEKLEGAAKLSGRSATAEIIKRLEASFGAEEYSLLQGDMRTVQITEESYKAMERFIEEIKRSNIDLSKLKTDKSLK